LRRDDSLGSAGRAKGRQSRPRLSSHLAPPEGSRKIESVTVAAAVGLVVGLVVMLWKFVFRRMGRSPHLGVLAIGAVVVSAVLFVAAL
jgi:hypothetical protein